MADRVDAGKALGQGIHSIKDIVQDLQAGIPLGRGLEETSD